MSNSVSRSTAHSSSTSKTLSDFFTRPMLKYMGFALLLDWHYTLWFEPHSFLSVSLLDDRVSYCWLFNLGSMALSLILFLCFMRRKHHLSDYGWIKVAAPLLICLLTIVLVFFAVPLDNLAPTILIGVLLGPMEAALWILWGEHYSRIKATFSILHFGTVFGASLLACLGIAWLLPAGCSTVFTVLLPLGSGALLCIARYDKDQTFPILLPKTSAHNGVMSMSVVCIITFVSSAACYFLAAIIPWEILPGAEASFTFGTLSGGIIMLLVVAISTAFKNRRDVFRLYPWLIVCEIIAFSLFISDEVLYFPAFLLAVGLSSLFEILLIMYFGVLTTKGYITPALAFGFAGLFARGGILVGNSLADVYEDFPAVAQAITPETCLVFICILAALLIVLVRQEYNIVGLVSGSTTKDETDTICKEVAEEFGLSAREHEILLLISHGHTARTIAEKLVISPYTVNTHIRHIYEKMGIHKRSELLAYLNMRNSNF